MPLSRCFPMETRRKALLPALTGVCRINDELPDAALEVAAGKCWELAGNPFTLAFCTGLDTCPSNLAKPPSHGLR
jgi:hypothetical protein